MLSYPQSLLASHMRRANYKATSFRMKAADDYVLPFLTRDKGQGLLRSHLSMWTEFNDSSRFCHDYCPINVLPPTLACG